MDVRIVKGTLHKRLNHFSAFSHMRQLGCKHICLFGISALQIQKAQHSAHRRFLLFIFRQRKTAFNIRNRILCLALQRKNTGKPQQHSRLVRVDQQSITVHFFCSGIVTRPLKIRCFAVNIVPRLLRPDRIHAKQQINARFKYIRKCGQQCDIGITFRALPF